MLGQTPISDPPGDDLIEGTCYYFPYSFILGFLRFLEARRSFIEIITYDDLDFGDDWDHEQHYKHEFIRWKDRLGTGRWPKEKIYVLIQHDVDRLPERTNQLLKDEERLGIKSNVMIFNRRVNRKILQATRQVEIGDYPIDLELLARLAREKGFVAGYHSNALEQAAGDLELAGNIFVQDVAELRRKLDIRYFSPHGGVRGPDGQSNSALEIPDELTRELRWVQNRFTVRFDRAYSDGAINSVRRDPSGRDLRDFARTWQPGKRYRLLLHPQYYHTPFRKSEKLARAEWYARLVSECRRFPTFDPWSGVRTALE